MISESWDCNSKHSFPKANIYKRLFLPSKNPGVF